MAMMASEKALLAVTHRETNDAREGNDASDKALLTVAHLKNGVAARELGESVPHVHNMPVVQHPPSQIGPGLIRLIFPVVWAKGAGQSNGRSRQLLLSLVDYLLSLIHI